MKKAIIIFILLISSCQLHGQHHFREKFWDCKTGKFVQESDTMTVRTTDYHLLKIIKECFEGNIDSVSGGVYLQIIVDMKGRACLLSMENQTGTPLDQKKLRKLIRKKLEFTRPPHAVSAVFITFFVQGGYSGLARAGLNNQKGWHYLKDSEYINYLDPNHK